jgi:hypothetical protein
LAFLRISYGGCLVMDVAPGSPPCQERIYVVPACQGFGAGKREQGEQVLGKSLRIVMAIAYLQAFWKAACGDQTGKSF